MAGNDPNAAADAAIAAAQSQGTAGVPTGSGAATQVDNPPVYLGRYRPAGSIYNGKDLPDVGNAMIPTVADRILPLDQAYDEFYRMPTSQQRAFAQKMETLGLLKPGDYTLQDIVKLWEDGVDNALRIQQATGKQVSPMQYYNLAGQISGAGQGQDGGATTQQTTQTQSNVSLSTKADARALLTNAFQSELGRDPSRKELRVFFKALRSAEKSKPSVTTGTTKTSDNGNATNGVTKTSTSTTSKGGVNDSAFAQNYIDDKFDTEKDQRNTATQYYDALLGLAGGG